MSGHFRSSNLANEHVLNSVKDTFESHRRFYDKVRLRYVMVKGDSGWHGGICMVHVFLKGQCPTKRTDVLYRHVHLREVWFEPEEFLKSMADNTLVLEELTITFSDKQWEREFFPANNDYADDPGSLYSNRWQGSANLPYYETLLAYELPFYPSTTAAIQDWSGIKKFSANETREGKLLIFVPECRARFVSIKLNDGKLIITVKIQAPDLKDLRIKGGWQDAGGFQALDCPVSSTEVEVGVTPSIEMFEAYLIGSNDTVYDFHRETRFWTTGQDRVLQTYTKSSIDEEDVYSAINAGEGLNIEFKPYITPGDSKVNELVKTAIAFANSSGGMILIGVNNDCTIHGIEQEINKISRKEQATQTEAYAKYIGELRQTINGGIHPTIELRCKAAEVGGHTVLRIMVPEGEEKPYSQYPGNAIYVRHGANNLHPPAEELQELLKGKTKNPFDRMMQ